MKTRSDATAATGRPLLDFLCETLVRSRCALLHVEGTDGGGFRLSFEDPLLQLYGLCGLLFRLRPHGARGRGAATRVRIPPDFEDANGLRDPFGVFTPVLLGVDPTRGLLVAFDPARHFPEDDLLQATVSADMVQRTLKLGWHQWLREGWEERDFDFAETLVGFRREYLFHYVHFERIAEGLDTPYRERLAEEFFAVTRARRPAK